MNWHAEPNVLEHYSTGQLSVADAASVEAHLLACARCRQALAPGVDAVPSNILAPGGEIGPGLRGGAAHAGTGERALLLFLVVAPLLPLAGVAAAFSPGVDPAAEVALASPMRTFRLLLVRATSVWWSRWPWPPWPP